MTQASPHEARSFLAWVWGGLLVLAGAGYLALRTGLIPYTGPILPAAAGVVAAISLPFLGRWMVRPQEGWALVTAWVFLSLGSLLAATHYLPGREGFVVVIGLVEIALPFTVGYLVNRSRWWLLIPAYVAVVLGALASLSALAVSLETLAGFALLAAALPFVVVYWSNQRQLWALIPAGVLGIAGVVVLVFFSLVRPGSPLFLIVLNATLAAVFLIAGLTSRRLDWAFWLAAGFVGAGVLSVRYPSMANWALLGFALGGYIIYRQVTRRPVKQQATAASAPTPPPASASASPSPPAASAAPSAPSPAAPQPVVEFRPLDPFNSRRSEDEK